jgi:DNA repair exonuclease SbcCD ATPase subunit
LEDGHSVYKSLSPRFPQLFQECIKSGCLFSIQRIGRLLSNPKKNYANWLLNRAAAQIDASSFTFVSSTTTSSSALTLPLLDLANDFKNILTKRELEHQEQVDLLTAKISALSTFQAPAPIQQPLHEQKSVPVSYSEKMIATIQEVKSQSKKLQAECEQLRQEKDVFSASAAQMEAEYAEVAEAGQMMAAKVQTLELKLSSCQNQVYNIALDLPITPF